MHVPGTVTDQDRSQLADDGVKTAAKVVDGSPISFFQWQILAICFSIVLLDGFDAQVIGATAPFLAESFGLSVRDFGPVFGAGQFGPMIGAITVGMIADRFGRKRTLVVATAAFGLLTLVVVTPLVRGLTELAVVRFLSGVALGGIAPVAMSLVSEYLPARRRGTLLAVLWLGLPAGGMLSGVASAIVSPEWAILYMIGGFLPVIVAIIALMILPESMQFVSRSGDSQSRLRAILARIDPTIKSFTGRLVATQGGEEAKRETVGYLFSDGRTLTTLLIWLAFFIGFLQLIFVVSWTPTMLHTLGARDDQIGWVLALLNLGSMVGTVSVGILIDRFGAFSVLGLGFLCAGLLLLALGVTSGTSFEVAATLVCLFGAFGGGATGGLLMLASMLYPTAIRATAIGWAYGLGRCGAIAGPMLGGALLKAEWQPRDIYLLMGAPAFIAACALGFLWMASRQRQ